MFINFKRLLLTLYRLEEGQQDILQRLEKLERGWKDSSGASHPQNDRNGAQNDRNGVQNDSPCHPEERSDEGSYRKILRCAQNDRNGAQNDTENPADTWIIDGIEAILSYRRNPKEETK